MTTRRPENRDKQEVRVRYAPSPTGEPHVGNIRTALFNWLFARHEKGTFIVRIEDTDQTRTVPGALETILTGLRWLGMDWQEGPQVDGPFAPYLQSERTAAGIYDTHCKILLESGWAYECYCPPSRLDEVRRQQQEAKLPPMYDRACRDPQHRERMRRENPNTRPVVRLKIPLEGETTFTDHIRGEITIANTTLDDLVLLKSDGFPTYHLANVVDDHLMEITHVIRGDEWLPSTPRHVLLYKAFGWTDTMPVFCHLPLILGPDKAKLSKRHGATSILDYQRQGYLPEVMVNFLALLGWSLDDKTEIIPDHELIRNFTLDRIGKTAAVFDKDKLDWMNGVYIRDYDPPDLADLLLQWLEAPAAEGGLPDAVPRPIDERYLTQIVLLIQERLKLLSEAAGMVDLFFDQAFALDDKARQVLGTPDAKPALTAAIAELEAHDDWSHDALEALLRPQAEELGLKPGPFFGILRAAVTGRTISPPLFETMQVLGRSRSLTRLRQALDL